MISIATMSRTPAARRRSSDVHASFGRVISFLNFPFASAVIASDTALNRFCKLEVLCRPPAREWTRECLAIDVAGGIRAGRVVDVLARLVSMVCGGAPLFTFARTTARIPSPRPSCEWMTKERHRDRAFIDPEQALAEWHRRKLQRALPRRVPRNGVVAARAAKRDRSSIIWRRHYNEHRPHSSLGGLSPNEFRKKDDEKWSTGREATL